MNLPELIKRFNSGDIGEDTFLRLAEKIKSSKGKKKPSARKKRCSSQERKARHQSLICVLALMRESPEKMVRKEKTDFDLFLADVCELADSTEVRRARADLNKLLGRNNMLVATTVENGLPRINVIFALKKKYRRTYVRYASRNGVFYANIHPSHIKWFTLEPSDNIQGKKFSFYNQ